MNERDVDRIHDSLSTYAARAIPDDLDLWPRLSSRLAARPGRHNRNAWTSRFGWLTFRRQPMLARLGAALLIGALLLVAAPQWLGREQSSASAAELLNNLATVAAAQSAPSTTTTAGYRYTRFESTYLSTIEGTDSSETAIAALVPRTREMWIAPDGSGRIRETAGEPVFLKAEARAAWEAAGKPNLATTINRDFGADELWYEDFASYPTDVAALTEVIRERAEQGGPPVDIEMFIVVGDLLRQPGVPPELRAALYKVAATIPGVELVGDVTDRAGRPGVAVAKTTTYWGSKQRFVLIFDPTTSALLGEEQVLLEPDPLLDDDAALPVAIGHATYLESKTVPTLPGEPLAPPPPDKLPGAVTPSTQRED